MGEGFVEGGEGKGDAEGEEEVESVADDVLLLWGVGGEGLVVDF